jgi:hypothetical protein
MKFEKFQEHPTSTPIAAPLISPKMTGSNPKLNKAQAADLQDALELDLDGTNDDEPTALAELNLSTRAPVPLPPPRRRASREKNNMDAFEVRVYFTKQLASLNASTTSSMKAAQFAVKHKDVDEDLHSCILEQLEKVTYRNLGLSIRGSVLHQTLIRLAEFYEQPSQHHAFY